MTPTLQDIQTLAYFEVADRQRRGAHVEETLAQLAEGADPFRDDQEHSMERLAGERRRASVRPYAAQS
jgi:hypothetical protein